MAWALSIHNGDFESQSGTADAADVSNWYDYDNTTYQIGPWFRGDGAGTINSTGCLFMSGSAVNTSEDGGHKAYVYQSIGNADGTQAIDISLQWGAASYVEDRHTGDGDGGIMGLTVMILESDGTFEPGQWARINDIYGASGVTEITRATIVKDLAPGVAVDTTFTLDISGATEGNELFLRINAYKAGSDDPWMSIDNITMAVSKISPKSPKDNARFIAVERTSSENDLVFTVTDPNAMITSVDVLFGTDPNLPPAYTIVDGMSVSTGNQYTITLNTELAADLLNDTQYYWKVIEHDTSSISSQAWSFKTIQIGPYLDPATPSLNGVFAGEDAEFTVFSSKTDTFQWYKEGDPDIALSGSDPHYSGVTTDTLTIHNVQADDEGFYYCVGTETATALTIESESGELYIKELKHYFPFNYEDVVGDITPDVIGGVQAQLMGGASVELFSEAAYSEPNSVIGDYLLLDNSGTNTEDQQYAQILDPNVFEYPEITVSAWLRMASKDGKSVIWACGTDTNNYWDFAPYASYGGNDVARSEFRVSSNQRRYDFLFDTNTDQWYFVTITNSDGTMKMYMDGEYLGTGDTFAMTDLTRIVAYIGKRIAGADGDYPMFNGRIDELKIYNYAMSTVEVAQVYLGVMTSVEYVCNEEIYDLGDYDYDGNCRVDLADFVEIISRWLEDFQIS